MNKLLEEKVKLAKEIGKYFKKNNISFYIGGDIVLDYFKNKMIKKNLSFNICVPIGKIKEIEKLNTKTRCIEEVYDKNKNLRYYKYIDKETLYIDLYNEEENSYGVYIKIYVNAKDYKKYKEIKVLNVKLPIPNNLEEYLLNEYGYGYKYKEIEEQELSSNIIYDVNIPYEEYLEVLKKNNVSFNKAIFNKVNRKLKKQVKYKKMIDLYLNQTKRTHARYTLLEKYESKKESIIKLNEEKKYDVLKNILNEYLIAIKKFYDLGLGLSFDKEIFNITIEYLKYDNQQELAQWLVENTPKEHLKNIDFTYKNKGKTDNGQLKDLQNNFLKLMSSFDNLCKKHKIQYFVDSGTVLGAVRNGGFLPWDDDVDVVLTHENWNKLVKVLEKEPIKSTKFVCIENNENHTLYTGKIYDLNSTKVYYSYSLLDSTYGFHLDVLILDENIDNKVLNKLHLFLFVLYGQLLNPNENRYNVNIYIPYIISYFFMKLFGRKRFLGFLRKIIFKNKNKKSKYYNYRWQKSLKYKKEIFKEQLHVPFENIMVPIPIKYEEYLEISYGESWKIIPLPEDRMPSKRIFNLYVPYYNYQDDYMYFIRKEKEKIKKAYRKLKLLKMRNSSLMKTANKSKKLYNYYKEFILINNDIDKKYVQKNIESNKYGKILKYLEKYYYNQIKTEYLKMDLLYIKDKEFLYNAIYTLIMSGKYYDARKLLKCNKVSNILRDKYTLLNKLIDDTKYINKKTDKEKVELFNKYPLCIPFFLEYYPLIKDKKEKAKEVERFNNIYPNIGEVEYIVGKYLLETDKKQEANDILLKAINDTRNGLIIKEIKKLL